MALVAGTISLFVYLFYITYMNVPIGYVMTVEDHVLIVIHAFGDAVATLVCFLGVIIFNMETPKKNTPQEDTPKKNTSQKDTSQKDTSQKDTSQKDNPQNSVDIEIHTCWEERV